MSTPCLARLHGWRPKRVDVDVDNRAVSASAGVHGRVYVQTRGREGALALCTLCVRLVATWRRIEIVRVLGFKGSGHGDDS